MAPLAEAALSAPRVLVTGAAGWLGREIVARLAAHGAPVRCLVHRAPPPSAASECVAGDLLEPATLAVACRGIEAVVHLAGLTRAREATSYRRINVDGARALAAAARGAGVNRFVHIGSRAAVAGSGAYGESKLAGELAVRETFPAAVVLRPAEIYGRGSRDAVATLLAWMERAPVVPYLRDARARIAPVYVDDVTEAIVAAALAADLAPAVLTLAGPEELDLGQFVRRAAAALRLRRWPVPIPTLLVRVAIRLGVAGLPPDRLAALLAPKEIDIVPARRALGFAPRPLEAGLADWAAHRDG